SETLGPVDWPEGLRNIRNTVEEARNSGLGPPRIISPDGEQADAGPALIVPRNVSGMSMPVQTFGHAPAGDDRHTAPKDIFSDLLTGLKGLVIGTQSHLLNGLTIVVFDEKYITGEFIPLTAGRFLGGEAGSEYSLTVISGEDSSRVFYQSEPAKPVDDAARGDVVEGMFGVRFDEMPGLIATEGAGRPGFARATIVRSTQTLSGDSSGSELASGGVRARLVAGLTPSGAWKAVLKHKSGSLEAAVGGTRRKNLAISFGVLMLVGASMGLLIVSTHRATRLARQQVEFVAGVSHEFRTPLSVICSAGENLADGVIDNAAQVKAYGKMIEIEGKRLTAMMEQVLE